MLLSFFIIYCQNIFIVDINQLEVLVTVARERSFSRAAEVLGRTQPAISQAVSRLERSVGEILFDRTSKDGTLTYAGEVLLEHATAILGMRAAAVNSIREIRGLSSGRVTFSANEHTVFSLIPLIERFRNKHPEIKIEVQRGVASRIPKQITAREVELGVVSFQPNDPTLVSVPLRRDELALVVPPSHPLAGRRSVAIRELGTESFVAHNAPSPYRQKVIEAFDENATMLNIAIELPSLEAIKRMVAAGAGIALLPRLTVESEVELCRLAAVRVKDLKLERRLNMIYRRSATLSHAARAFVELASEEASRAANRRRDAENR